MPSTVLVTAAQRFRAAFHHVVPARAVDVHVHESRGSRFCPLREISCSAGGQPHSCARSDGLRSLLRESECPRR